MLYQSSKDIQAAIKTPQYITEYINISQLILQVCTTITLAAPGNSVGSIKQKKTSTQNVLTSKLDKIQDQKTAPPQEKINLARGMY